MSSTIPPTTWGDYQLVWGKRTYVMGIVNVTPDSFSGDGLQSSQSGNVDPGIPLAATDIQRAIDQVQGFIRDGATIIDVGGESTRPGNASLVSAEQEAARVIPVIKKLREILPANVIISIDTYKAKVAAQALAAGANILNDIWGLRHDQEMAEVASQYHVPVILMANMRGFQKREIVSDVMRFLAGSIELALKAGVLWEHIILDPGIGFGMTPDEDLTVQRRLSELRALGRPILLGTSRKSHIGRILGGLPPEERIEGTAATVALGIAQGADIVRVHNVREMVRVVKMSDALVRGTYTLS
jgi:dihydropteroate synthase